MDWRIKETVPDANDDHDLVSFFHNQTLEKTGYVWSEEKILLTAESEGKTAGRLLAVTGFDWLIVRLLKVEEPYRNKGLGRILLQKAEDKARALKLVGVFLNTGSWEAPGFYESCGYECFAELPDFPKGHKRFSYRKILPSE